MKLSAREKRKVVHAIAYGLPKVGKTELVGELAEHGFTLWWFDFENGSITLDRSVSETAKERINVFQIPDTKDFPIGIEVVLKVMKPGKHWICHKHGVVACGLCGKDNPAKKGFDQYDNTIFGDYDIVVFDSLTQISNSAMSHIGKNFDDTWKPEWEHYRTQGAMLDRFLSGVQNAPYHVIVLSHENEIERVDGTKQIVPVAGTTNFSRNTAKYFDEVIHLEIVNRTHRAASSTTYSIKTLTGSRSRLEIEKQFDPAKPSKDQPHITLLPIFTEQGITPTRNQQAEVALLKIAEAAK